VAGAGGEGGQIALLPGAGLIGGRNSAIKGGALSQLNSPCLTGRNPLSLFGLTAYRTALTLFGTIRHAETPRRYPRAARGAACLACHRNRTDPALEPGYRRSRRYRAPPQRPQ